MRVLVSKKTIEISSPEEGETCPSERVGGAHKKKSHYKGILAIKKKKRPLP